MTIPTANYTQLQSRVLITHRIWEITVFLIVTGGLLAAGGWYYLAYSDSDELALLPRQINALVIATVIYTNLAAIGVFGVGSLYGGDGTIAGLYAVLLWNHFILSLLSGAFLLWSLLNGDADLGGIVNECATRSPEILVQAVCARNFANFRSLTLGTTVGMMIVQLVACIMASHYVSVISKTEDSDNTYTGPETDVFWEPQTPQDENVVVVDMQEDSDVDEYKTPRTAEFSRFAWV